VFFHGAPTVKPKLLTSTRVSWFKTYLSRCAWSLRFGKIYCTACNSLFLKKFYWVEELGVIVRVKIRIRSPKSTNIVVYSKNTVSPSSPKVCGLTGVNRRHLHTKWWRSVKKLAKKGQNTSFYNVFSPCTTYFSCSTKHYDQTRISSDSPCYSASMILVLCPTSAYSRSSVENNAPKHVF